MSSEMSVSRLFFGGDGREGGVQRFGAGELDAVGAEEGPGPADSDEDEEEEVGGFFKMSDEEPGDGGEEEEGVRKDRDGFGGGEDACGVGDRDGDVGEEGSGDLEAAAAGGEAGPLHGATDGVPDGDGGEGGVSGVAETIEKAIEQEVGEAGSGGNDEAIACAAPKDFAGGLGKDLLQMGGADGAGEVAVGAVELARDGTAAEDAVIEADGLAVVFGALKIELGWMHFFAKGSRKSPRNRVCSRKGGRNLAHPMRK